MVVKVRLQKRIVEPETAQAMAETLDQIKPDLNAASEDELLQVLAWLTFAAAAANSSGQSLWTMADVC